MVCIHGIHHHFICPIIRQYAHLLQYNFGRAGQQDPTRTLTAALKRELKQLLGTYSITQVKYYKRENETLLCLAGHLLKAVITGYILCCHVTCGPRKF